MANIKISNLPTATSLSGTNIIPIVDTVAAATKKITAATLLNYVTGSSFNTLTVTNLTANGASVVDVSSSSTALRITQRGSGEAIRVEDQTNPDSTPFIVDGAGNVGIGTYTPTAKLDVNGNLKLEHLASFGSSGTTGTPGTVGFTAYTDTDNSTALTIGYHYIYKLVTTGTGTRSGATYLVFYNITSLVWEARLISRGGSQSNHPLLRINGSTVEIYTNHPSAYTVWYVVERYFTNEDSTTIHFNGADSHWTRDEDNLYYADSSGKVGIGTSSPSASLHVNGDCVFGGTFNSLYRRTDISTNGVITTNYADNSNTSVLILQNRGDDSSTTGHGANIQWQFSRSGSAAAIAAGKLSVLKEQQWTSTASTQDAFLALDLAENGVLAEKLRISSNGNVGIGTSSPSAKLHISQSGGSQVGLRVDSGGGAIALFSAETAAANYIIWYRPGSTNQLGYIGGGAGGSIGAGTANTLAIRSEENLYFATQGGTPRMVISGANGDVGIGTTSPSTKLHISGGSGLTINTIDNPWADFGSNAGAYNYMAFRRPGSTSTLGSIGSAGGTLLAQGTFNSLAMRSEEDIYFATQGGTPRMVISGANGNVGIGTTSPAYQLQLSTDSAAKPSTNTWTISSDIRVKENIRNYTKGLETINNINPAIYDYNGKAGFAKIKDNIGLIAQDILNILPESISTYKTKLNPDDEEETELYNFNSHALTYVMINSIKELKKENDDLVEDIKELKKENKNLKLLLLDIQVKLSGSNLL